MKELVLNRERCLLAVIHDITERKLTEAALREREEALRQANADLWQAKKSVDLSDVEAVRLTAA